MSRKSYGRKHREYDFSNIAQNHVMPEDVPVLIRTSAEQIAGAFYEDDRSPRFRGRWINQDVYVKLNWASFVPVARKVLSHMLELSSTSLAQKEEIYEAFVQQGQTRTMLDFSEALAPGNVH
jgi:hypothetical protein